MVTQVERFVHLGMPVSLQKNNLAASPLGMMEQPSDKPSCVGFWSSSRKRRLTLARSIGEGVNFPFSTWSRTKCCTRSVKSQYWFNAGRQAGQRQTPSDNSCACNSSNVPKVCLQPVCAQYTLFCIFLATNTSLAPPSRKGVGAWKKNTKQGEMTCTTNISSVPSLVHAHAGYSCSLQLQANNVNPDDMYTTWCILTNILFIGGPTQRRQKGIRPFGAEASGLRDS